jgi:hypothetical protein
VTAFISKYSNNLGTAVEKIIDPNDHLVTLTNLFFAVTRANEEIYLIVDEYDSFANRLLMEIDTTTSDLGYARYKESVADKESFLRTFGNVLKHGTEIGAIDRMYFTGVAPVAFCDSLSSLNMVRDISMDKKFESTFGFTESEVRLALGNVFSTNNGTEMESHFNIMKANFNGYRFNKDQSSGIFNFQMVLYYLQLLQENGTPPEPLLDPNIAIPSDNVASYLINNYRGLDSLGALDFVLNSEGLKSNMLVAFRSQDLFDKQKVDDSLRSLAYYHGYLTFSDPSKQQLKELLVCPNEVYKTIFVETIKAEYINGLLKKPNSWLVTVKDSMDKAAQKKILERLKDVALSSLFKEILNELLQLSQSL